MRQESYLDLTRDETSGENPVSSSPEDKIVRLHPAKRVSDGPLGGLLDANHVQQVWRDFLRGATSWTRPWSLYVLRRWCELQSVSG